MGPLNAPGHSHLRSGRIALALAAVYIAWGSTYLAIRIAIAEIPPFAMGGLRFCVAGLVFLVCARVRKEPWPNPQEWCGGFIAGVLLLGIANGSVMVAERTVPSGFAALIAATTPLILVLFELGHPKGERLGAAGYIGVLAGFVGVCVLLWPAFTGSHHFGATLDIGLLMLAPIFWAAGTSYSKRHELPKGLMMAAACQSMSAGLLHSILGAGLGEFHGLQSNPAGMAAWAATGYLVVVGSLVGFSAFAYLVRTVPASLAASNSYVNPVVAVVLGSLIAHEPFTLTILAGAVLVIGAVALLVWPGQRDS